MPPVSKNKHGQVHQEHQLDQVQRHGNVQNLSGMIFEFQRLRKN